MSEISASVCELADRRVAGQVFLYALCGFSYAGVLHSLCQFSEAKVNIFNLDSESMGNRGINCPISPYIVPISS